MKSEVKRCLTISDVADRLNISKTTAYKEMENGNIPCFKIGGQWRVDPDELEEWMKNQYSWKVRFGKITEKFRDQGRRMGITPRDIEKAVKEVRKGT